MIDELWAFETNREEQTYTALSSALHKREDAYLLAITTAGYDKQTLLGRIYEAALGWPDVGFPGFPNGLLGAQAPGGPPDPTKINVVLASTLIDGLGIGSDDGAAVGAAGALLRYRIGRCNESEATQRSKHQATPGSGPIAHIRPSWRSSALT